MPDREKYGEFIRGNWVSAIKPKGTELNVGQAKAPPKAAPQSAPDRSFDLDDDSIPF